MATINGLVYPNYNNQVKSNQQMVAKNVSGQIQASQSPSRLQTDAVYTTWNNPNSAPVGANEEPLTLLHLNDNHRKVNGLAKFKTAMDEITQKVLNTGGGLISAHSGDYNAGTDLQKLQLQVQTLNELGIKFTTIGNHEVDVPTPVFAKALQEAKFMTLAANVKIPEGCGVEKLAQSGKFASSTIYETGGNKYGLVGLAPPDLKQRIDPSVNLYGFDVLTKEETINAVQQEVDKLKAQGINRIVLISHVGLSVDREIAKATDGIDIILGGHSHDLLDPLEPGVSLFNSKSNEPVMIFQNGKNAKFLGVTDAYFDNNGIVKAAIARQENADNFVNHKKIDTLQDNILGKSPVIGVSAGTYTAEGCRLKENAIGNFVADSIRAKAGADIAIIRGSEIRDTISEGEITERTIEDTVPFVDYLYLVQITGQDVIDAIDNASQTYARQDRRPGVVHLSGARYTISEQGRATNVEVLNNNGQYEPIDPNKEYKTVYNGWSMKGAENFKSLAQPTSCIKAFDKIYADMVKEVIRDMNFKPVEMKTEGRIKILAKDPISSDKMPKALQKAQFVPVETVAQQPVAQPAQPVVQPVAQQPVAQQNAEQPLPTLTPRCAYKMPQQLVQNPNYYMYPPVMNQQYYVYPPVVQQQPAPQGYYYYQPATPTSYIR